MSDEEEAGQGLRKGEVRNALREDCLNFGVVTRHSVANDHQIGTRIQITSPKAQTHRNRQSFEQQTRGRVDLFVRTDDHCYRKALNPYGAVSLVTVEGEPVIVPDAELEALQIMVDSEIPYNPYPYLKTGRKIRVKYGPLEGCEGVLVRKRGLSRLVVTVHLLQRSIEAELDATWIEPGTDGRMGIPKPTLHGTESSAGAPGCY